MDYAKNFATFAVGILLIILACFSRQGMAIEYSGEQQPLDLTSGLQILEDEAGNLTIDDVRSPTWSYAFEQADHNTINRGFTESAIWARFQLSSSIEQDVLLEIDYPLMDHVELYVPDGHGGYTQRVAGDSIPFGEREIHYRNFLFNLGAGKQVSGQYFLRFTSNLSSIQIPLRIWTYSGFSEYLESAQLLLGSYYGIMLVMTVLTLILYFIVKDVLVLLYSSYLLCFQLLQLSYNGLAYQYLWPGSPMLQMLLPSTLAGLTAILALLFTRSFLETRKYIPGIDWVIKMVMVIAFLGIVVTLSGNPMLGVKICVGSGLPTALAVVAAGGIRLFQGFRPARYFLLAWSVFLFGVIVLTMFLYGMVPNHFFFAHAMQIGSVGEVILLAMALGDRIATIQRDKTDEIVATNKALVSLNENLEERVSARTRDLEEINIQLKDIALRDSLTGLLNHKAILEQLQVVHSDVERHQYAMSVAMLDIDYFKRINDKYGH